MYRYFKMRTLKVILVVDIFLNLAVEYQEVILSPGVLSEYIEYYLGLDRDAFDGEGVSRSVCCALDKNASFAVSHQIADVYDQAHRLVILN